MMTHKTKWLIYSVAGVTLVGLGLTLTGDAIVVKSTMPEQFDRWFFTGLFGLASVNAGICFIADAVRQRILSEE
jgi:hypothetical protein